MKQYVREQSVALTLTVATCAVLIGFVWLEVRILNHWIGGKIALRINPADILVGAVIYLKTAIDFVIFIGQLMSKNPGLKGRIGIEIGTALGNGIGTMLILVVWAFFKEVHWLLAVMIVIAALVLLRLAQDTLVHARNYHPRLEALINGLDGFLASLNRITEPVLSRIVPSQSMKVEHKRTLMALLVMAFTVPFILGLDDFAGYVPLFTIVNVFSFAIGVLLAHMLLNISLYISPGRTIAAVKNPLLSFAGSVAFVGLAGWGLIEAFRLLFLHA
ncbi:MAG: hypothetical protein ACREJM_06125 [Candidatus Saccharimonadales bacterium]